MNINLLFEYVAISPPKVFIHVLIERSTAFELVPNTLAIFGYVNLVIRSIFCISINPILIASFKSFRFSVSLIHLSGIKDTWDEIKLGGIKEYFHKQYPQLDIHYDVVQDDDLLNNLEQYIEKENIDIIALTSYRRNIFYRLFNPSIARKMIFHSDTPMLVLTNRS